MVKFMEKQVALTNNHDWRYERKFLINNRFQRSISQELKLHPSIFSEAYPERRVNNFYYDDISFASFFNNVMGVSARKKTRIRYYGRTIGKIISPRLELKIKNGLLGTKVSYPLKNFNIAHEITRDTVNKAVYSSLSDDLRPNILSLNPILLNTYKRKYYLSQDKKYRVTMDYDLKFYRLDRLKNNLLAPVELINTVILEIKYSSADDDRLSEITNNWPYRLTKSSKYVMGVEALYPELGIYG